MIVKAAGPAKGTKKSSLFRSVYRMLTDAKVPPPPAVVVRATTVTSRLPSPGVALWILNRSGLTCTGRPVGSRSQQNPAFAASSWSSLLHSVNRSPVVGIVMFLDGITKLATGDAREHSYPGRQGCHPVHCRVVRLAGTEPRVGHTCFAPPVTMHQGADRRSSPDSSHCSSSRDEMFSCQISDSPGRFVPSSAGGSTSMAGTRRLMTCITSSSVRNTYSIAAR